MTPSAFVVGFPGFLATTLVRRLLDDPQGGVVLLLVDELEARALEELVASLAPDLRDRLVPLYGKEGPLDLGLSGAEIRKITDEAGVIWSLPSAPWPAAESPTEPDRHVEGTRELLAIAREARQLRHVAYFSSAFVCGVREGVVLEEEGERPRIWRHPAEEALARAEAEARRAMGELRLTIFRPTIAAVDARTGHCDPASGATAWFEQLLRAPGELVTGGESPDAPLQLVPADWVVACARALLGEPAAAGRTIHLADPQPLPLRAVAEAFSRGRSATPGGRTLTGRLAAAIAEFPGRRERRGGRRFPLTGFGQPVLFRGANLAALLPGGGPPCPPCESYLDRVIERLDPDGAGARPAARANARRLPW